MKFNTADVADLRIFYREAGEPSKPNIVLLHGFPSSSYSFHDLIPRLADRFHIIAPDYPGHGVQRSSSTDHPAADLRRRGQGHRPFPSAARVRAAHLVPA